MLDGGYLIPSRHIQAEMHFELWVALHDPVLIGEILVRTANQVECLAELLIAHADLSDSHSSLESINVEEAILVVVLPLHVLYDYLRVLLEGAVEALHSRAIVIQDLFGSREDRVKLV